MLQSASLAADLNNTLQKPVGTGGFLDPQKIVNSFGITESMRIADFGSGAGYFTIIMAKIAGESALVSAVDILDSALDQVRTKAKNEGLRNIQTIRANLEIFGGSGLDNDSQDIVLLANILFQSDQKSEIVKEAKRVLRPGGRLILIDWRQGTGGFGPPDNLRLDEEAMRSLVTQQDFQFVSTIDTGSFHYGLIFQKI